MFRGPRITIGVLLLLAVVLTACGGPSSASWSGLASDDANLIYVAHGDRVVAVNPLSGATRWEYPNEDDRDAQFYAVPLVADGTLFIGDYKGRMHAVNAETGAPQWLYEPEKDTLIGPISLTSDDRVISGAAVSDDKVFFGLGSRNVVAVSRESAAEIWTFETEHGVWAQPLYVPADQAIDQQATLYIVSLDHRLYAIDPESGDQLWRMNLGGAAPGAPVYDQERGRLYIGTFVSEMLAIDLAQRQIVDRYATENWVWGSPVLENVDDGDDMLYFGDLEGYLYALRLTDNGFESEWKQAVANDAIRATPLLTNGLVIVGSKDHHVYAVSKESGATEWEQQTEGEVLTELVFVPREEDDDEASGLAVVGTSEGDERVIALNVESGDVSWRYSD
ncbi:MAG: PQQ-binding-like beta-propeller repeat protein [Chloroflexi bacterium]|nr:PQQ-binding-like beta-propeller repeat protein [Chloroflexota bacterium]